MGQVYRKSRIRAKRVAGDFRWSLNPGGSDGKKICLQCRRPRFSSWVRKIPWKRKRQPTPVFLPGKFCGQRSLVGYSPWACKTQT